LLSAQIFVAEHLGVLLCQELITRQLYHPILCVKQYNEMSINDKN